MTDSETQCVAWRAIKYSAKFNSKSNDPTKFDTPDTIQQVRVHNATGVRLGCWKK